MKTAPTAIAVSRSFRLHFIGLPLTHRSDHGCVNGCLCGANAGRDSHTSANGETPAADERPMWARNRPREVRCRPKRTRTWRIVGGRQLGTARLPAPLSGPIVKDLA